MPLTIAQLGQPVLRQVAAAVPLEEIPTPQFQKFLTELRETLAAAPGVGLAAPQVFASRRVFLARVAPEAPPEVFINPRITGASVETMTAWEGCLSFPELLVNVHRAAAVRVEFLDGEGRFRVLEMVGLPARVVQHELDHLDGVLTIDRAASSLDIVKASEIDAVLADRARQETLAAGEAALEPT